MHQFPIHLPTEARLPASIIKWQDGPIGDYFNGATVEGVVRAVIDRVTDLNSVLPCEENRQAVDLLNQVLEQFDKRTRDRYQRGVMGTAAT